MPPAAAPKARGVRTHRREPRLQAPSAVDYGSLPGHVGYLLRLAQLRVWDDFYARMGVTGISPSLFSALILVERNPGLQQSRLGEALGVARSGAMTMVDRLEKLGLVERRADPDDRRAYGLFLSSDGRRRMPDIVARVAEHDRLVNAALTAEEHRSLMQLLQKFVAAPKPGGSVHSGPPTDPVASRQKRTAAGTARAATVR